MNILDIVWGILGLIVGLFVWSAFWGTLFATIPVKLRAKREGLIKSVKPALIFGQLLFSVAVILLMYAFLTPMFYGSLVASVLILFSVQKLRAEAVENLMRTDSIDKSNS